MVFSRRGRNVFRFLAKSQSRQGFFSALCVLASWRDGFFTRRAQCFSVSRTAAKSLRFFFYTERLSVLVRWFFHAVGAEVSQRAQCFLVSRTAAKSVRFFSALSVLASWRDGFFTRREQRFRGGRNVFRFLAKSLRFFARFWVLASWRDGFFTQWEQRFRGGRHVFWFLAQSQSR